MSKSFMILFALLAVAGMVAAGTKSYEFDFYEDQERFFPIESLTGNPGCFYHFGELDIVDVNATTPRYTSPRNLVKVGFDAIKPNVITVNSMRTVCDDKWCSIYVIDDKGFLYSRFGEVLANGTWVPDGDRNMSEVEGISKDKFTDILNTNDVTVTVSQTEDNQTRFIIGLPPGDKKFTPENPNFVTKGVLPSSEIEYIIHPGIKRSMILLDRDPKKNNQLYVISFEARSSVQTPEEFTIDAKALNYTAIFAIEADKFNQQVLYVFGDTTVTAYNVSDIKNWVPLVSAPIAVDPAVAATSSNLVERKTTVLVVKCNNNITVFDASKPTILKQFGALIADKEEINIDFSERLNYLYVTYPGADYIQLEIYDMRLLTTPANSNAAKRFENNFQLSSYSSKTILSIANMDDTADMVFWFGVNGDIYKFYDVAGLDVSIGVDANDTDHASGSRPGAFDYEYKFTAIPIYCPQSTENIEITINLKIILSVRRLTVNDGKQGMVLSDFYPGILFSGPTQTVTVLKDTADKLNDKFDIKNIVNPLEVKTDSLNLWDRTRDVLVDEFTERGRAFLLVGTKKDNETAKGDLSYRIISANMTREVDDIEYLLNQTGTAWTDVEACFDLFAMKDAHGAYAFVVCCSLKQNATHQGVFTFTNVTSDFTQGTQTITYSEYQVRLKSNSPFNVDIDSNVLFQVFDSDENNGIFADSTFIDLPGLTNHTSYTVKYSDIKGPNNETVTNANIINFDVIMFDDDKDFHFGLAATTSDFKVILAFVGANNSTDAQVYDLTTTSIFTQDVFFENPFFSKIEFVNDDCLKANHHTATILLISPNFYSYKLKLGLDAEKKPYLQVINAFAYFPEYRTVDAKYDSCTSTFVTLNDAGEKFTSSKCYMAVYPGNTTNASSYKFEQDSYAIIEPAAYRGIPCPTIMKADTLGSERINGITVITFSTADDANGEVASVQANLNYVVEIANLSLPVDNKDPLSLVVVGQNPVSDASVTIKYPYTTATTTTVPPTTSTDPTTPPTTSTDPTTPPTTSTEPTTPTTTSTTTQPPGPTTTTPPQPTETGTGTATASPTPGPSPDSNKSGSLTWLWILLGIVGVILIIAAVVWVLRNRKDNEEALLDGQNDMSLQQA